MNKKVLILPLLILSLFVLAGCSNDNKTYYFKEDGTMTTVKPSESETSTNKIQADKIQVFLFHATKRCTTCIAIGRLAGATVDEYFQNELQSGKIEFKEINIDLPENKELAQKFQASGSALFINAVYDGQDHISGDATVWRLTTNEAQFKSYLKTKIDTLLGK